MPISTPMDPQSLYLNAELSAAEQRAVQRMVAAGQLRRVRAGIAASLPPAEWPALFRREKVRVLAALFPGAVVAFRSAFDGLSGGTVYLAAGYPRTVELPGLKVVVSEGPGPVEGDTPIQGLDLHFPSRERMLLEAMAPAPKGDDADYPRKVSDAELEARLISICDARGDAAFNDLRERTRSVAALLGTPKTRVERLDGLMGAILGTRPNHAMATAQGAGRARGYDQARLDLFKRVVEVLAAAELPRRPEVAATPSAHTNFAFLESYFSNFIEGTEFSVGEARAIVFENQISAMRPKDAHDILGVYNQAFLPAWRDRGMTDLQGFAQRLRARHTQMMARRPEMLPGEFKTAANAAGNTTFVEPRLVVGTLHEAGLMLHDVDAGLPRALLAMAIITEVHPFNDGNGRLSRLVMNAELSAAGECRIIVPTLYREQYLDCLRVFSREGRVQPLIDAMVQILDWTAAFNYDDLDAVIEQMARCHAFERSLVQHRLLWPGQDDVGGVRDHQGAAEESPPEAPLG